jgi:hypothetical protein
MAKKISGAEYELAKIFSSEFEYVIPTYQRPYAWTVDQASELFDDLFDFFNEENDEGYFLGSIVLIKEEGVPLSEVIDGQQRLTTLTILLSIIASETNGEDRTQLLKYIVEPGNKFEGLSAKPRLTLRERDKDFFAEYIQALQLDTLLALSDAELEKDESKLNIKKNADLLRKSVQMRFGNEPEKLLRFVTFLLQRCFLVAVSTPSQQSAFRVFSVMNSRGLDLQTTDIIKADMIGKITNQESRENYNQRWEDMEVELGRSGFNDLFGFVRMIYAREKPKKALLEEFRSRVIASLDSAEILISEVLEPYAEAMATLISASYKADEDAGQINAYIRWLNRIDNSDWMPTAMCFLKQKPNNTEYVEWFFRNLERLAASMHITGYNVNQRIERYAIIIEALSRTHNLSNPVDAIELTDEEKQRMKTAIDGDVYWLTPRRRSYLVLRLDSFVSDQAAVYDTAILTIEHVLPQTVDPSSEWATRWEDPGQRSAWVHRIGNLVPLNKRRNSQAQNYDFGRKKDAYFLGRSNVSSYALTSQVIQMSEWTPEVVEARQQELLSALIENWKLA